MLSTKVTLPLVLTTGEVDRHAAECEAHRARRRAVHEGHQVEDGLRALDGRAPHHQRRELRADRVGVGDAEQRQEQQRHRERDHTDREREEIIRVDLR